MAYEVKVNTGNLFKNDNPKNENSPPYTGKVNIGGAMYYQSAWVAKTKDGKSYFNQKFTPMDGPKQQKPEKASYDIDADDIPF